MEEDRSAGSNGGNLETGKAERQVWLMKCPLVVSKSWQSQSKPSSADSQPSVAKVTVSVDPLCPPDDPSSLQVLLNIYLSDIDVYICISLPLLLALYVYMCVYVLEVSCNLLLFVCLWTWS